MSVDPRLLQLLCCPFCAGRLKEESQSLRCDRCSRIFAVHDGVPDMVDDQETSESTEKPPHKSK